MTQVSYIIPYQSDNETRCFVALDCNDMEKSGAADFTQNYYLPLLETSSSIIVVVAIAVLLGVLF